MQKGDEAVLTKVKIKERERSSIRKRTDPALRRDMKTPQARPADVLWKKTMKDGERGWGKKSEREHKRGAAQMQLIGWQLGTEEEECEGGWVTETLSVHLLWPGCWLRTQYSWLSVAPRSLMCPWSFLCWNTLYWSFRNPFGMLLSLQAILWKPDFQRLEAAAQIKSLVRLLGFWLWIPVFSSAVLPDVHCAAQSPCLSSSVDSSSTQGLTSLAAEHFQLIVSSSQYSSGKDSACSPGTLVLSLPRMGVTNSLRLSCH